MPGGFIAGIFIVNSCDVKRMLTLALFSMKPKRPWLLVQATLNKMRPGDECQTTCCEERMSLSGGGEFLILGMGRGGA
jgi:hypothetical protein